MQYRPLVLGSICLIFSIESISKFSRNSTLVFESFIRLPMLAISASVSPAQSILGFGTPVKSILFGTISLRAVGKSINDNGFLSDLADALSFFFGQATRVLLFLPRCAKSSLSKFKFLIFVG